ncbi:MAG: hypothetical protein ABI600_11270 [Luteolibacter sp.]
MRIWSLAVFLAITGCASTAKQAMVPTAEWSRTGMVAFCRMNHGKKVGDGQCWALANEAMKAAGKSRPGRDMRVWGRVVNPANEQIRPGDVLEFENARFRESRMTIITGSHHTAVVMTPERNGKFTVAEQNFWGNKRVSFREMSLRTWVAGKMTIFRPG